jgi:hypothetical protein
MGIAAHEIGHAIGMLHEMSRQDRDTYVTLNSANIPDNYAINFNADTRADEGTGFDFLSLMMYGAYAFTSTGEKTISPHNEPGLVNYMGQRMGFSERDVELIGRLYSCADQVTPQTANEHLSQEYMQAAADANTKMDYGHSGECADVADDQTGFVDPTTDAPMPCKDLRIHCSHDTLGPKVRESCPVSCYVCQPGIDGDGTASGEVNTESGGTFSSSKTSNNTGQSAATRSEQILPGFVAAWLLLLASA